MKIIEVSAAIPLINCTNKVILVDELDRLGYTEVAYDGIHSSDRCNYIYVEVLTQLKELATKPSSIYYIDPLDFLDKESVGYHDYYLTYKARINSFNKQYTNPVMFKVLALRNREF